MDQQILNTIATGFWAAFAAFLAAMLKVAGSAAVQLFNEKAVAAKARAGTERWDFLMSVGRAIWSAVEEDHRINPALEKTIASKQALFTQKIRKAIPEITDDEVEEVRQAIGGEVNKGKAAIKGQLEDVQGNGIMPATSPTAASQVPSFGPAAGSSPAPADTQ